MPKELHEITKFTSGTITVPDEKDIPEDAASYSVNIDSVTEGGRLKGIPKDVWLKSDGTWDTSSVLSSLYSTKLAMINKAGQRDVIRYDPSSNGIHNITDFYVDNAAFAVNDMGDFTSSADEVTMQVHNKEVHIGMGRGSTDVPKWVGYVDHEQFGTAVTPLQIEDAELKAPASFPPIYNAVTVGNYVYGIQYGGTRIYRFYITDNEFDSASHTQFASTQGICLLSAGTDIWLYDDNAAFGSLYKIDVSEWGTEGEISQESNINGWGSAGAALDAGFDISDIFDNGTVVWFQGFKDSGTDSGITDMNDDWLFNATIPTSNGELTTTDVTPRLESHGTAEGALRTNATIYLYKQGLVGMGVAGVIGVVCFNISVLTIKTEAGALANYIAIAAGLVMLTVGKDYNTANHTSRVASGTDDYQIHEVINAGSSTDYGGSDLMGGFAQDDTRLFVAKIISSTSTTLYAMDDVTQTTIASGATTDAYHTNNWYTSNAQGNQASIPVNGLVPVPDADRNPVYMLENNDGGSFMKVAYDGSTFTSLDYLERSDIRMSFTDVDDGEFKDDVTYFWKFAYMYDGYQESPLSHHFTYTPADEKHIQLTIDLYNLSGLPKRVSHLVVYRAENSTAAGVAAPDSFYRLVKKMKIDTSFALQSSGWGDLDYRRRIHLDQLNNIGSSYEARNLMPETLEDSIVNYALSTQINSMHIVGKCYKTEIPDATNFLFKSKANNFDQFDWTTDFLRLPTMPTALASFNGRIYAFDENNTYRINPQGFYVEDTFEGAGCYGSDAVVVTEYGMCYCDKNNIYLHDGKAPKPIATPILTGDTYSWGRIVQTKEPMVMFDSERKSFIIFFKATSTYSGSYYFAWAYNIIYNRWDLLSFDASASEPKGILHGKNGELFVAQANGELAHFMGHTSTTLRAWEWRSKNMTMGEDTLKKKFYDVSVFGDPEEDTPTITYGIDGDSTPEQSLSGGKVQSGDYKSKSIRIKLVQPGNTSTEKVDSVGIIYRRLPKTSGNI